MGPLIGLDRTAAFGASTSLPRIRAKVRSSFALQTSANATAFDFRLRLAPTEYPTNLALAQVKRTDLMKLPQEAALAGGDPISGMWAVAAGLLADG